MSSTTAATTRYNGWKNYETWNVSLWLQNDEFFYNVAANAETYGDWVDALYSRGISKTDDNVEIDGYALDYEALDALVASIS